MSHALPKHLERRVPRLPVLFLYAVIVIGLLAPLAAGAEFSTHNNDDAKPEGGLAYPDFYMRDAPDVNEREQAEMASSIPFCSQTTESSITCRNATSEVLFGNISSIAKNSKEMSGEQVEAISWLADNEIMLIGGVIVQRVSPTNRTGHRSLDVSNCPGVLSATCDNYAPGNSNTYNTHLTHYPPNGGTVTDGWEKYTQLVYNLNQNELHRVWTRCDSTNIARKKWLFFNHGFTSFNKQQYSKAEVWIRKQAYCCGYGLCSFTNW